MDLLNNDSIKRDSKGGNIFEFKPGHRWGSGATHETREADDEN